MACSSGFSVSSQEMSGGGFEPDLLCRRNARRSRCRRSRCSGSRSCGRARSWSGWRGASRKRRRSSGCARSSLARRCQQRRRLTRAQREHGQGQARHEEQHAQNDGGSCQRVCRAAWRKQAAKTGSAPTHAERATLRPLQQDHEDQGHGDDQENDNEYCLHGLKELSLAARLAGLFTWRLDEAGSIDESSRRGKLTKRQSRRKRGWVVGVNLRCGTLSTARGQPLRGSGGELLVGGEHLGQRQHRLAQELERR